MLVAYAPPQNKLIKYHYFKMGSPFSCLTPAGAWGGIYSEVLQKRDLRVEEQLLTCASSSPKFQSEDSYWALTELHSLTPPLSCLIDPATVPSAITVVHTSWDENYKHSGKSPQRAAHAPSVGQNPAQWVGNLIYCSL